MNKLHSKVVKGAKKQKAVPVRIVSDSPTRISEDMSWRARSDLSTLQCAEEIRRDRARMSAAKKEAQKQIKALSSVGVKR
jgi:hypothetical protein